jgi:chromosome segregation protein
MLKRLELVGFKSFADKTQFDFSAGITAIVGPNGSGKSNIVDGVRWVLGEQSAKSLRGGEMIDVIFNGSASRRSLGLAEVTMVFDNTRHTLATDSAEVQITRRVYRSGEGEYLINQQVCRLKDIKDLFLGSGAGNDAYSIIEQGRVDVMLQASTKDRRTIFEEAAGISRFKAKKIETMRKLERVDQNLLRLRDILEEVEKQLRSVKLQAAKAQRYQEYTTRLKELRVGLSLQEYHQLSLRLQVETADLDQLRALLQEQMATAESWERQLHELEEAIGRLDGTIRGHEAELATARQQIATETARQTHEWSLAADLEQDLGQTRRQLMEADRQVTLLSQASTAAGVELQRVEQLCLDQRQAVESQEEELQSVKARLLVLGQQVEEDKEAHIEAMRASARLQNDVVSYKAQVDNLARERQRLRHRSEQAAENLASLDVELQQLKAGDEALQVRVTAARQTLSEFRQQRERLRGVYEETNRRTVELRTQRSGLGSRIEILEGLERSHEGLGTGPREVLALLEQGNPGPWKTVMGIVADFLTVRREYAPLIDLALGDRAQRFLVRDAELLAVALRQRSEPFSGRVSFLPVTEAAGGDEDHSLGTDSSPAGPVHPAIVAQADKVARCEDTQLADLPSRLLGRTLIVRDLASARSIAAQNPGFRCITLQGELLDADGTLTVGTHHAEAGILSRKSELRELREQVVAVDLRLDELEHTLLDQREELAVLDGRIENQQLEINILNEQVADLRSRIGQQKERRAGLHEEMVVSQSEMTNLEQEINTLESAWQRAREQVALAEASVQDLAGRVAAADHEIRQREEQRQQQQQQSVAGRVALAQTEQRLKGLLERQQQLDTDLRQREKEREQRHQHLQQTNSRLEENQRTLLAVSSALAMWYRGKEQAERLLAGLTQEREQTREQRQQLLEQTQHMRSTFRTRQEEAHARELEVNDLRHKLDALCGRLTEDYQLDLGALYQERLANQSEANTVEMLMPAPASPLTENGAAEENTSPGGAMTPADEIVELRRKLARLGNVNLEAIQELSDMEARHSTLQIQYDDLTAAQQSLQEIINRINNDSRRLFSDTFATIRTNFQELFRKLFGGGMADIVLEDENDILESGIEVIARPPGKELRSISLMSGGEKTMTAVALLLAIFRSRPSPFCILDEVDAALDEANVGRFTAVLRDYLDRSQFIIITHSKRTMQCADVLYGVTMQESGISRRISIRFEDYKEEGAGVDVA